MGIKVIFYGCLNFFEHLVASVILIHIIPGQLGDKQSPRYIVPGLRCKKEVDLQ